ncbi:MAG: hypothetical protein LBG58_00960 [Planctomycetaceae bacterium]|jgi:hypothetical protein|nr:hypothetical protein [Planctomycetaceae bacterium]
MGEYTKNNETVKNKCSQTRVFDFVLTWFFGLVMLVAAIPHLENPYYFLGSVYSYNLTGSGIGQLVAILLPLLQLAIALCFILRVHVDSANIVTMILFGVFFCIQLSAFLSGLNIQCGCFGPQYSSNIGIGSLSFVGTLFTLSVGRFIITSLPFVVGSVK